MTFPQENPMGAASITSIAKYQNRRGVSAPGTTVEDVLEWLESSEELRRAFLHRYGEEAIDEARQFAGMQSDIAMAEMRQIQLNQYRNELVPGKMVVEIRDLTVQLIRDTIGASYIAQLEHYGVPPEIASRGQEDLLRGLRSLYTEFALRLLGDSG